MKQRWMRRTGWVATLAAFGQILVGPIPLQTLWAKPGPSTAVAVRATQPLGPTSRHAPNLGSALTGSMSATGAALAKADVALARSLITPNLLRGDVSERLVNETLLRQLQGSGNWHMIRPRLGSQGIDGILVRFDARGDPRQIMVAETKYNTSRLGMTADGVQMGGPWRRSRLRALAGRYSEVAEEVDAGRVTFEAAGRMLSPHNQLDIPLPGGRTARAWRDRNGPWKIDVDGAAPRDVRSQAVKLATLLNGAAEGRISYHPRVFEVKPAGKHLLVLVHDTAVLETGAQRLSQLPVTGRFTISLTGREGIRADLNLQQEMVRVLQRKMPHFSDEDAMALAAAVSLEPEAAGQRGLLLGGVDHFAAPAVAAGVFAAAVDPLINVASEWFTTGQLRAEPGLLAGSAAMAFGSTTIGVATGEGVVLLGTRNAVLYQFARSAAGALGLPTTSIFTNATGGMVGAGVSSVAYAIVAYEWGWMDAQSARRAALTGVIAGSASTIAFAGTMTLVAALGTASTGTAISTLSGAAATSASFAWLGGGSVATGGGGAAFGSIVLSGGVVAVGLVVGLGVAYAFHYHDTVKESERILLTIQDLKSRPDLSEGRFNPPPR